MVAPFRVATHEYVPVASRGVFSIMSALKNEIISPSGLSHATLGLCLELEASQSKLSVSPSLTVVAPLITGALNTAENRAGK